jgi:tetratricopeptide (TPR) repeat protein
MSAVPQPPSQPTPRRRRRVLVPALLCAVVVTAGGIGLGVYLSRPAPPAPPEVPAEMTVPDVVTAIQSVRAQVLKEPSSAAAWGRLGEVFLANELEEPSRPCFAEAERLAPANPRWPYFQAGVLLNRGDREAAVVLLHKAVRCCDAAGESNTAPRLLLAETLLTLGRLEEAEEQIQKALQRQPEDPRALFDLGLLAVSRQDWQAARDHLRRCLGSPLTRQRARAQLALVVQRLGDTAAADQFRAEAERLPRDTDWLDPFVTEYLAWSVKSRGRYKLAESLERSGRLAEAADVLRPLAAQHPDDDLAHLTLGKVLAQMGRSQEAEQSLRRALRLAPQKVQAHHYLSLLLFQEGEQLERKGTDRARAEGLFREAAALARQALALKPDYGVAHMALGLSLRHLGQRADAVAAFRQAVHCNPEYGELHFRLGEMLAEDGPADEARSQLEQALLLAPPDAAWRQTARARLDSLARAGPSPPRP